MRSTRLLALAAATHTFALVATPSWPPEPRPSPTPPHRVDRERLRRRAPRCVSPPSMSAPPAPTGAPPATGCTGRFSVAREIKSRNPGIVAIQELGPGRADGKKAKIKKSLRQTQSLVKALRSVGAGKYKLARTTAYVAPGTSHATQGARILYNKKRYRLVSKCRDTTDGKNYSKSCSMDLPVKSGDAKSRRRSAAYAEFEDRRTGKNFWVISVHLDDRHSGRSARKRR